MKTNTSFKITLMALLLFLSACNAPADAAPSLEAKSANPPSTEIQLPVVKSPAFTSIDMLDENNGWAITETQIVRTEDGGSTWYNVSPQGPAEFGYMTNPFFLDAQTAWVLIANPTDYPNSGMLFRTTDGGLNWQTTANPFSAGKISFLDPSNGWSMADFGAGTGNMAVAIFQTKDGGTSWTRNFVDDPTLAGSSDSLPLSGFKNAIAPLDMDHAFIGGLTYASGEAYLYETKDAGKTWARVSLKMPENTADAQVTIDDVKFVSPKDGYFVIRVYMDVSQTAVYVTHDAGATWSLTPKLITDSGSQVFISATDAILYTPTNFYATHDSATTWTEIVPDGTFGQSFATLDFVNLNTGWVVTVDPDNQQRLLKTTDGGATWLQIVP